MAAIVWDRIDDRVFEGGLDRGVLYFPEGGGVAWNGLLSVSQNPSTSVEAVYYDGVKFNDIVTPGDFAGTITAYTYPDEFLEFEGILEDQTGMFLADQQPRPFHMSYRTMIRNNVSTELDAYKIHLLWNLTAVAESHTYATMGLETTPDEFSWSVTAVPEDVDRYRPTAHLILDSRVIDPYLLEDIEGVLYGTDDTPPTLPSLKGFTSYIRKWERLIIIDNGDGTWTATSPLEGVIEMLDETTFEIEDAPAEYSDADTYEITSSEKNEEDIF